MAENQCPECGGKLVIIADGEQMTEEDLNKRKAAPKSIKHLYLHELSCATGSVQKEKFRL